MATWYLAAVRHKEEQLLEADTLAVPSLVFSFLVLFFSFLPFFVRDLPTGDHIRFDSD